MRNNMVNFTKCWLHADSNYGEKEVFLNIDFEIRLIEGGFIRKPDGKQVPCTTILYDKERIKVLGSPLEFIEKCKESNAAMAMISELHAQGITIKQFLQQHEGLNGVLN